MKTLSIKLIAVCLCCMLQRAQAGPAIELDSDLFEQLIADKNETRVKDSQRWFIFFDLQ